MSFIGYTYAAFGWAGNAIARAFRGLYDDIVTADMRIYPPAYASLVAALTIFSLIVGTAVGVPVFMVSLLRLVPYLNILSGALILLIAVFGLPLAILGLGLAYPKIKKVSRISRLELEVPYLSVYITVMATGGISPYVSFERLAKAPKILFNEIRREAMRFFLRVRAMGIDPLTSIEESAKRVPHQGYKQLMLGYAATLRAGGDVVHYLHRQTEVMLTERVSQVKTIGERISMLMESYMAVVLLTSLVIYTLFVVNFALAQAGFSISGGYAQFAVFSYIILPMLSGIFIYLADMMQPKYPIYDTTPYKVFFGITLPVTTVLFLGMSLPFLFPGTLLEFYLRRIFLPLTLVTSTIAKLLNLPLGFEGGVGMIFAMAIGLAPAVVSEVRSSMIHGGIQYGITRFLRDLVEVRKTGMAPEKCVLNLRRRDYGRFSKHMKVIARQVGWGLPLSKIYEGFASKVKNWFALIAMFLLVESIEVGGGTPRTLEALATYAETLEQVEKEKRAQLKPLLLIPYVGAVIIVVIILILIGFMNYIMSMAGGAIGTRTIVNMFLPPVIINSYMMGLVAGKVSSERVSAGFKHVLLLLIADLIAIMATPMIVGGLIMPIQF